MKTTFLYLAKIFVIMAAIFAQMSAANAQSLGEIKVDATVIELKARYKWSNATNSYEMYKTDSRTIGSITGSGAFQDSNEAINKVNSEVPGVHYNGYARYALVENNGKVTLVSESGADDIMDGVKIKYSIKTELEVVLTKGRWSDYLAGETIEFSLTHSSKKKMNETLVKTFVDILNSNLNAQFAKHNASTSTRIDMLKGSDIVHYTANKSEMTFYTPSYRVMATFPISVD